MNDLERNSITEKIKTKITGKRNKYKPKSFKKLFYDLQDSHIEEMKNEKINFKSKFNSIPNLKCEMLLKDKYYSRTIC